MRYVCAGAGCAAVQQPAAARRPSLLAVVETRAGFCFRWARKNAGGASDARQQPRVNMLPSAAAGSTAARRTGRVASHLCVQSSSVGGGGTVLIIGASRGIGLGLAKSYAASGWTVHATTRTPENPGELGQVVGSVQLHGCDVTQLGAGASLAASLGAGTLLDLVIFNAGINPKPEEGAPESRVMYTNGIAPFLVLDPVLQHLGGQKKLALISSQLGSREVFGDGKIPAPIYHASKTVLNDGFREQEPMWRARYGLTSVIFHPGWVVTDMGGSNADITVEESVEGMKAVLNDMSPADTGKFFRWNGTEHPW
jgi:NAD(P)-dependent dehydrogenase (short-subunit alcohol dehydrogenase family)